MTEAMRHLLSMAMKYAAVVILPGLILMWVLESGKSLSADPRGLFKDAAVAIPMPHLMLLVVQITVVLLSTRLVGLLFKKMGQPQVVGEMVAGFVLGPSIFGHVMPDTFAMLFPSHSLGYLYAIAQVGILIFMFLVGLEFDHEQIKANIYATLLTAHGSIALPFALAAILAYFIYPIVSPGSVPFVHFALFMGSAMSVTAFPVLARILSEKGLLSTDIGRLVLACAAIADVSAWIILAAVIALVRAAGRWDALAITVGSLLAFTLFMLLWVRPLLRRWLGGLKPGASLSHERIAALLAVIFLSAAATEWFGVHALFGAFLSGVAMPQSAAFVQTLKAKLEDVTLILLLPLFFAFTGLRTDIGGVHGRDMVVICALVILTATVGKVVGSALSARTAGLPWQESLTLGVFMNARGLMELIVLNLGLDLGIISPPMFTIMVLMAFVTTFSTAPLYDALTRRRVPLATSAPNLN